MHHYTAFGLQIHSEIPLPELADGASNAPADLLIRKGTFSLPDVHPTMIYRRGIRASFGQDREDLYLDWAGVAAFKAIQGRELVVSPDTVDANLLSLFTVSEAMGLILFQKGHLLLHASAVAVGDEAWCFMGTPGAGKSTTAAAFVKAGCRLLSDDLTAIVFDEKGVPSIIPAYPQLKIWDKTVDGLHYDQAKLQPVSEGIKKFSYQPKDSFSTKAVPLKKILFLHQNEGKPGAQSLHAAEIPGELVRNFPLPGELLTGDYLKKHFFQSLLCAQWADIQHQQRPRNFELLEEWVQGAIHKHLTTK